MKPKMKNLLSILIAIVLVLFGGANLLDSPAEQAQPNAQPAAVQQAAQIEADSPDAELPEIPQEDEDTRALVTVVESGEYTSKNEVAAYIHQFGHLPANYITKRDAEALGWVNSEGNLWKVAPGKSIGGDYFGNYEGILPKAKGRKYTECDIDFGGKYRNSKRIIFSNDGLIFYTSDHYNSFTQLYGRD